MYLVFKMRGCYGVKISNMEWWSGVWAVRENLPLMRLHLETYPKQRDSSLT